MFVVELQQSKPIIAVSPEDAVKKVVEKMALENTNNAYFNVYHTDGSFYVIAHNVDSDPIDGPPEFEKVVVFTKREKADLIEEMMYKAQCDDSVLRQICGMAANQINTNDAYDDWTDGRKRTDED